MKEYKEENNKNREQKENENNLEKNEEIKASSKLMLLHFFKFFPIYLN